MIRKLAVTLVATTTLLTGSAMAAHAAPAKPDFRAQAIASGLTAAQATSLQQRVDGVLAAIPGGRQVSATQVNYDGLTVTFDPTYSASKPGDVTVQELLCSQGWLCMIVRGIVFSFYKCQYWSLSDWWGVGPYKNYQTRGTVARFYDKNWVQIWTTTAVEEGEKDWTPFWFLKVC